MNTKPNYRFEFKGMVFERGHAMVPQKYGPPLIPIRRVRDVAGVPVEAVLADAVEPTQAPMVDPAYETATLAVLKAVQEYLPNNGVPVEQLVGRVIAAIDNHEINAVLKRDGHLTDTEDKSPISED